MKNFLNALDDFNLLTINNAECCMATMYVLSDIISDAQLQSGLIVHLGVQTYLRDDAQDTINFKVGPRPMMKRVAYINQCISNFSTISSSVNDVPDILQHYNVLSNVMTRCLKM